MLRPWKIHGYVSSCITENMWHISIIQIIMFVYWRYINIKKILSISLRNAYAVYMPFQITLILFIAFPVFHIAGKIRYQFATLVLYQYIFRNSDVLTRSGCRSPLEVAYVTRCTPAMVSWRQINCHPINVILSNTTINWMEYDTCRLSLHILVQ